MFGLFKKQEKQTQPLPTYTDVYDTMLYQAPIRRNRQPSLFQAPKKVSPAVRVLTEPVHDAKNILVSVFVRANNNQHTLTVIVQARVEVDTVGPNIDVALS